MAWNRFRGRHNRLDAPLTYTYQYTHIHFLSEPQTPIFGEHGEPAAKEKIWAKSAVLADYGLDTSVSAVLQLVRVCPWAVIG